MAEMLHTGDVGRHAAFVLANTVRSAAPLVPEVRLRLASEVVPLWELTEEEMGAIGLPPPFWAFAWAGGQALARYVLDHPGEVRGRRVLDLGCGCGLVAIAARVAGAAAVTANDVDPFALAAAAINAEENGVEVEVSGDDLIGGDAGWDVVLVGDAFYDRALAGRLEHWLGRLATRGATVLIGDPGRAYLPRERMRQLAAYDVRVPADLEDREVKRTAVWRRS
jgi:predicted nicotinamide N-methyase